jgi:hypothetical protein
MSSRSCPRASSFRVAASVRGPAAASESSTGGAATRFGALAAPVPERVKDSIGDFAWIHSPM